MDVGLYLDLRNPPDWRRDWASHYAASLELASHADELGIGQIWLSEHHFFEDGYLPQPLTFAAAVAARTRRARIGTAVLLAALRHSLLVAEESAIVDILSGGRLDLGIGAGYRIPEFSAYGVSLSERYRLVEQSILEIRHWWLGGRMTPPPIQQPIPIWGGFFGPRGAKMAGRLNVGLLAASDDLLAHYQSGLKDGGHDLSLARMRVNVELVLSDDPERTWSELRPFVSYQWTTYRKYMAEGTNRPTPRPVDPEPLRLPSTDGSPPRFQVLTPDAAAEFILTRYAGLPVEQVYLWASIAGMPDHIVHHHVDLLCTRLGPLLRSNSAPALRGVNED